MRVSSRVVLATVIPLYYLAPGVTFIHDVGFIIHTTKAVLLRVKVLDFVHIDTNTGYGM